MPAVYYPVLFIFIAARLLLCESARTPYDKSAYSIPAPKIEVFTPKGFRISIPDSPGVRLFAFHGNINQELLELDAGKYSKEVQNSQNGRWVIEDKQARLRVGDKIYYWVFVIKDNLGYRLDKQCYIIDELLPSPLVSSPALHPPSAQNTEPPYYVDSMTNPPTSKPSVEYTTASSGSSNDLSFCQETVINATHALISLRNEVDKLKKLNKQLIKGLNEYPGSKQVKLMGHIPPNGSALSVVQLILNEKLDLTTRIVWAVREDKNSIMFEVPSVIDKYEILVLANDKLKNSKFDFS